MRCASRVSKALLQTKARGADIRIVYSPMDALKLAQENPTRKVVFFGLGFETTMPTTAITLQQAKQRDVQNFYFSASTSRLSLRCAACWNSRTTVLTPFSTGPRQHGDWHRCL